MKKLVFIGVAMLFLTHTTAQNNLLDTSTWTLGTDWLSDFPRYGSASKNVRELDYGPHSTTEQVIVWKGLADTTSSNDGGWRTPYITIDPSKKYRFTVWLRKINSNDGTSYFGFNALDDLENHASLKLDGTATSNPYFSSSNFSFPSFNEWHLFVAYVYPYTHTSTTTEGGVYSTDGTKIADVREFKFASTATQIKHRSFLIDDNNSDELHFYAPTIYEVNGQEPTLQELINGPNMGDTTVPTAPTLSSSVQTDTTADLSWSGATDNVGVTGYKVFKDGVLEATLGNVSSYQVTGLTASTTYSFTAKALDAAANESVSSNAVSVTTDSGSGGGGGTSVWSQSGSVASYNGDVAIGTTTVPTGYKLAIDGKLIAEEIKVQLSGNWPDYVFKDDYELLSLEDIRKHIEEKGHLPNIPSAKEVEVNGVELGEMNRLLLEKIEELTLYILQQEKRIQKLENNKLRNDQ